MTLDETETINRQRRHLTDVAIGQATRGEWEAAVSTNQEILELGGDTDAFNRLGKALAELGRHAEALEAYQGALARDATNRIAERNVGRLRVIAGGGDGAAVGDVKQEKASASDFIEEMGKTGHARLINLLPAKQLASLSAGDAVELMLEGSLLVARVGDVEIGQVEPRIGSRLSKLMKAGNRYDAAITTVDRDAVRVIIHEAFAHPANFGKVSFPASATGRPGDVRPYIKGTPLRYDDEEESEESEEETEEVEELDTSLPEFSAEPELEEELLEEP
jgi:predicted negative regulator of RcsB-dependent stress response